jgi:hypothetical protein
MRIMKEVTMGTILTREPATMAATMGPVTSQVMTMIRAATAGDYHDYNRASDYNRTDGYDRAGGYDGTGDYDRAGSYGEAGDYDSNEDIYADEDGPEYEDE